MLVDSHCHLDHIDLAGFSGSMENLLEYARQCGVQQILSVAIDLDGAKRQIALAKAHAGVYATVGVHPSQRHPVPLPEITDIEILADRPEVLAIGETGLDFYRDRESIVWQKQCFERHLEVARRLEKPVIIHTREAREETIAMLRAAALTQAGVMHCFTESWEMASEALDLGFYISFSGIITFRNAEELRAVVKKIPLDRLLVETDAPWLAPVPYRGKQNQPAYVREVAGCVAEIRGLSIEDVADITHNNFQRLFRPS